jgi:hypothetical protein
MAIFEVLLANKAFFGCKASSKSTLKNSKLRTNDFTEILLQQLFYGYDRLNNNKKVLKYTVLE